MSNLHAYTPVWPLVYTCEFKVNGTLTPLCTFLNSGLRNGKKC